MLFLRKLKTASALVLILLIILSLFGCQIGGGGGGNSGGAGNGGSGGEVSGEDVPLGTKGLIFNSQTDLKLILADERLPAEQLNDLVWAFTDNLGERLGVAFDTSDAKAEHEIIIGETDREISKVALGRLEVIMSEEGGEGYGGYVLYSDGSSLALVYTDELTNHHVEGILKEITEWASKPSLVKKRGVVSSELFNMYEIYEELDEERRAAEFALLEQSTSPEIAKALSDLYYALYTDDIISWLANLYEPRKCVCDNYVNGVQVCLHPVDENGKDLCHNGGFYYSNSARNTLGFLPDVESTYQALSFLEMTGMLDSFGENFGSFVSGQLKADIVAFTKGLQNEDGYFYHPQWTVEESRSNWARVSRDLMWSEAILTKFGSSPYYRTPTGSMSGSGGRPAAVSSLTEKLGASPASAVSCVIAASSALPEHLRSAMAFEKYLSGFTLDVFGSGYYAANELAAQVEQLVSADKALNGALKPLIFDFFEEKHNPQNGLWRAETDYDGLNTLFKALMVYSAFGEPFNYAEAAAESAIAVLSSDEVPGHVCGMYNTWYGIAGLISNIRAHHPASNRAEIADSIQKRVIEIAPAAIANTAKFTNLFKKEDGSFSYFSDHCSETSQGMVVSLRRNEGDVNASTICTGGMMDHMGMALGVKLPSIFGLRQLAEFTDIIESNGYSLKDELPPDVTVKFEDEEIGSEAEGVKAAVASGGSCLVAEDPKNSNNKVLNFRSLANRGAWDAVYINNNTSGANSTCIVFEGKFMFAKEGTDQGYLVQFYIGSMGDPSPYFLNFTIKGNYVEVWEASSDDYRYSFDRLLGKFPLDEWFKLRIEYYFGYEDVATGVTPHDTVRIKVYTNDELVAVSANYFDAAMTKFLNGKGTPINETKQALFFPMTYLNCNVYFDDLYLGYKNIEYKSEKDTEGLIVNEDAEEERRTYTFDGGAEDGVTLSGSTSRVTLENGAVNLLSNSGAEATLSIPALHRTALPNVFALGFDISAESASLGDVLTLKFREPYKNSVIVTYTLKCIELDGALVLAPVYKGTTMLNSAAIPLDGEVHHLEFAFFVGEGTTLIYKDGNMVASTEQGAIANSFLYEMSRAEIVYSGVMSGSIDNLYCERREGDFSEEIKPKIDRVVYDFSGGVTEGLETDGKTSGGKLTLSEGAAVTVPVNERSPYVSAYQLFMDLSLTASDKDALTVKYLDSAGVTAIGVVLTYKNGVLSLYEMMGDARVGEVVGSVKFKGTGTLRLDLYEKERALEVYVNDKLVLVTAVFNGTSYANVSKAKISAEAATLDNLYLDGITLTYTAPKLDEKTKDDTNEVITYDHSSLGNYPDRVVSGSNVTQNSSVEYVERDGEMTKAFVYNKVLENYAGGVTFNFGDGAARSRLVFETDIKLLGGLAAGGWRSSLDLYFSNNSGGTHMYILQINIDGGHIWAGLHDGSTSKKVDCGAIPEDGWFNIRTEVKAGDGTATPGVGTSFTLYINGVEIFTSSTFSGSISSDKAAIGEVYKIQLIPLTNSRGTIYLDNTVIKSL